MRHPLMPALALAAALMAAGSLPGCAPADDRGTAEAAPASSAPLPASARGADVILITLDTLRADTLGFAGHPRAATPVLDRLAAAGRVYTDAHAHNVVTLPSHANILTGRYPYQHGIRDNSGFTLPASVPTLGTMLRQAGYRTGAFVAAYPLDSRFGLDQGFDLYDDDYPRGSNPADFVVAERRGDQVIAPALRWWRSQRGHRRFLWVHLYDPHAAYAPPEPFASRFRDNPYLGEVAATDSFLAPLLQPLLGGKEPPALVVVTSDHGEALGEHGELTHGLFAYEATLKVPLVLWGAGVRPGKDTRPARHIDIVPTVLGALGVKSPSGLPGRSLLGPASQTDTSYFESLSTALNRGWAPLRGTLRERRKYIELPLPELYDLARDPGEQKNLFGEERRAANALRQALPEESVWPPRKGQVSPEEEARLRSLGYMTGDAGDKASFAPADDPKNLVALDRQLHQVVDAYSRGRYEEAARVARQVVAARPTLAEGYEHLALALRQLERQDEAVTVLRQGVTRIGQGGGRDSLRRQLGQALAEAGRPAEAVEVLAPVASGSSDASVLGAYGIALSDAGRHGEAAAVLQRALSADPSNPKVLENLGIIALRMRQPAAARDHLRQALALNDRLPIAWNTLGVALYQLEGPPAAAAALDAWERAVAIDPAQYDALYNIGLVAREAGRREQARRALERFVRTAPPSRFGPDLAKARQILAGLGA
ncbi:MAG TPA: sulfatase-like hydrolase/transferase [Thermoanaerobaculia bacterium]|nr:sulfatase-like hydrolase/transferase [Thermoanaerobaculia bacterium]